ncbi:hypothetical protein PLICRDRAFT_103299 [Plicaturopsis crispa FD-325 SS-3]|nr:hypothetical protein PLICRDRAFT_103299 [Plicaturopsis crispa FD-325 SS-3]
MGWGPEYGTWTYRQLSGSALTAELTRLAEAKTIGETDCVTIQPCPNPEERSQDRYAVSEWDIAGGKWAFSAIFDGHGGEETANFAVAALPLFIESSLSAAFSTAGSKKLDYAEISGVLSKAIIDFDDRIGKAVQDIFPGGEVALSALTDDEIRAVINDQATGGKNSIKVLRAMRGSTVLVTLIDPKKENLWVASCGDCQAILGVKAKGKPGDWTTSVLSSNHNGADPVEAERIRSEHPGEEECVLRNRVLGSIAVTRSLGDYFFKFPRIWLDRVFFNSNPGFVLKSSKLEDVTPRNLTPPYMSAKPDVQHVDLTLSKGQERLLIMCSDGLMDPDLIGGGGPDIPTLGKLWVDIVANGKPRQGYKNKALRLLREALGGDDENKVSRMLTVEMTTHWMDDTTILVRKL